MPIVKTRKDVSFIGESMTIDVRKQRKCHKMADFDLFCLD
jgi:hypothetical protein